MAVMTDEQLREGWAELMDDCSSRGIRVGTNKPNLRAAYDAIDAWVSANAAAANQAIPQPARGELTQQAKALLLLHVVQQRYLKGV